MRSKALVLGCASTMALVWAVHAQTARPQTPASPQPQRPAQAAPRTPQAPQRATPVRASNTTPAAPAVSADEQRAFLNQYCSGCHSEKMKAAGLDSARRMTIDALDPANVDKNREKWELIVRKTRAGQMPPLGVKRPDPARFDSMIASFETTLDTTSRPFTPPPGLHRLNRTEYANVVHDLLNLQIDPGKYLPSD